MKLTGLPEEAPLCLEEEENQMYFVPSSSGSSASSLNGTSSRICAPRIRPSTLRTGMRMPAVRVPKFTIHLPFFPI